MGAAKASWLRGRARTALAAVCLSPLLARWGGRLLLRGLGGLALLRLLHVQCRVQRRGNEVELRVWRGDVHVQCPCSVRCPARPSSSLLCGKCRVFPTHTKSHLSRTTTTPTCPARMERLQAAGPARPSCCSTPRSGWPLCFF